MERFNSGRITFHRHGGRPHRQNVGHLGEQEAPGYGVLGFYVVVVLIVVQWLNHIWLFATPWTAVRQASLSMTISRSLLKLMSIESVMPSNQLILCRSLSPPPIFMKVKVKSLSRVQLFATPWTVAHQAPLSMGFSRQEYWSGLPFPSPGDLPDPGIKPKSPTLQADTLTSEPPGKPRVIS